MAKTFHPFTAWWGRFRSVELGLLGSAKRAEWDAIFNLLALHDIINEMKTCNRVFYSLFFYTIVHNAVAPVPLTSPTCALLRCRPYLTVITLLAGD